MTETTFASRFAAALALLGISQSEAARRLGCTPARVNHLLSGERVPTLDAVHEYALTLGVDPSRLDPRLRSVRPRRVN